MFALLRTRRYPEGGVGSSRHIPGERPACWVPWLAQRPWRPLVRPKGPRAPCFIRKGGINNNNNKPGYTRPHSEIRIYLLNRAFFRARTV